MKIATLTFHRVLNHGAMIQTYALQKYLISQGYESEVLDYRPAYFSWQLYRPAKGFGKSLLKYKRILKFREFRRKYIKTSPFIITDNNNVESYIDHYYALICGSDQIWNKNITGGNLDRLYFLDLNVKARLISYAASSGGENFNDYGDLKTIFNRYHALSTREISTSREIDTIIGRTISESVVDPSLLISDFSDLINKIDKDIPQKFIVSYEVSDDISRQDFEKNLLEFKTHLNLPVIHIGDKKISVADKNVLCISPDEWISYIQKSEYVFTNSFHGVCVSLNLKKKVVFNQHITKIKNERVNNLLEQLELKANITFESGKDYTNFQVGCYSDRLNILIDKSKRFLKNALLR